MTLSSVPFASPARALSRPALIAALTWVAAAPGCWSEGINEVNLYNDLPPGMSFRVLATPTEITPGEEMSIVLLVENGNDHTVTLNFTDDCTAIFLVEEPDGGRVYPREGQECPLGGAPGPPPPWHMFPSQRIDVRYTWTGVRADPGGDVPADPGLYHVVGVLGRELGVRTLQHREVTIR